MGIKYKIAYYEWDKVNLFDALWLGWNNVLCVCVLEGQCQKIWGVGSVSSKKAYTVSPPPQKKRVNEKLSIHMLWKHIGGVDV